MVESFRFLGTTINRIEMGRQYDINRQERPTAHVLPSPTEEVWSQQEDPHTVLSGSYWECADILNQYLVWQCQCSWPKTTWWHCQSCIKTHGLWTAVTGVHVLHTDPAQSKIHHRRWTASCSLPSPTSAIWEVLQDYQNENFSLQKQFLPQSSPDCVTNALNHHTVIFWPTSASLTILTIPFVVLLSVQTNLLHW